MRGLFHLIGQSTTPWLVVFDNLDDLTAYDIHHFLPSRGLRLTLITSRNTESRRLGHEVKIGNLNEDEALSLLFGTHTDRPTGTVLAKGRHVIQRLGHLALAIAQASAYIIERNMDLEFFLVNYENEKQRIHTALPALWRYGRRRSGDDQDKIPLSIATTWELSLNLVSGTPEAREAKTQLLVVSAFFGRTNITEDLFKAYSHSTPKEATPPWMHFFTKPNTRDIDSYIFREAITEMGRLCLLQSYHIDAQGVTWQFHPVVQDWAQIRQGSERVESLALTALSILQCSLEDYENGSVLAPRYKGETYQRLRPHVEACYTNCRQFLLRTENFLTDPGLVRAATRIANFFSFDGRYEVAKELQRRMADIFPPGSPEHKRARWQLANTLIRSLEHSEAAKLLEEAVRAQVKGSEDVEDAFQLLELSSICRTQALNPRQFPDWMR